MTSAQRQCESFWDFREFFREAMRARGVPLSAESEGEYRPGGPSPVNERLIQAVWFNQLLRPEGMRLSDGRPLRVLDPGRWNESAGPDFIGARLMIGADTISGDVEIHIKATDWRIHRHESDLDYNRTVLHVVLENDDGLHADRLHNGAPLPRFEIEPYLFPDLETIRRSMTPDDFLYAQPPGVGKCFELMTLSDPALVADFLDRAGDERLAAKTRRLQEQLASAHDDIEQVFYQAVMMSLGTGPGKSLYYLLAKRAPLKDLLDYAGEVPPTERRLAIESILLHVAGLVPEVDQLADSPPETLDYHARLAQIWEKLAPYWTDRQLAPSRRWFRGIRPVNFPTRRLSAAARLIARRMERGRSFLEEIEARVRPSLAALKEAKPTKRPSPLINDLVGWFEHEEANAFWATHYSFAAAPAARPMALLGESSARSLVLNAAIPALRLYAQTRADDPMADAAGRLYALFPPLQANHITEFMTRRLFGEEKSAHALVSTERRRQGLFQIFYSCCSGEERHCDACYYLNNRIS